MVSPSPAPSVPTSTSGPLPPPINRHALTAVERQRMQLSKLLKDPSKPVNIPAPPKEKTIRPPREMMKNVQGSSAGAGSGEFHVYKANRRREYERLKLMEESSKKESEASEFEQKRKAREDEADAKTSKNRAKRMKKKERAKRKGKGAEVSGDGRPASPSGGDGPLKKRRLVSGNELVFKLPGDRSDDDEDEEEEIPKTVEELAEATVADLPQTAASQGPVVHSNSTIHDLDT